jgi:molybdopterin molybdotransferase
VLTTGDEIVAPDESPRPHQIRNSNSAMLASLLRRLGADPSDLGIARDDPALIRDAIARAIEQFDVVFITGGMSMGEHDYVPRVLRDLGVELRITKLRIKPGKPFVFGLREQEDHLRYVFGLPGNPVSGFACTIRLCARLLARLAGEAPAEPWVRAMLESDIGANGPREFYQPAVLTRVPARGATVRPLQWKGSGDVFTLAGANCLLVRAANEPARRAGTAVDTLEFPP